MPTDDEDQEKYWQAAAECIELARTIRETGTRADLLTLAQTWLDVADHRFPPDQFLTLVEEFNGQLGLGRFPAARHTWCLTSVSGLSFKGELSSRIIDRDWPCQVVVPSDEVAGENYNIKHRYSLELPLAPRGYSVRWEDRDCVVFCFADSAHAELFRE